MKYSPITAISSRNGGKGECFILNREAHFSRGTFCTMQHLQIQRKRGRRMLQEPGNAWARKSLPESALYSLYVHKQPTYIVSEFKYIEKVALSGAKPARPARNHVPGCVDSSLASRLCLLHSWRGEHPYLPQLARFPVCPWPQFLLQTYSCPSYQRRLAPA